MAIAFKHRYKSGSLIGTGAVKFRPYTVASPSPQLATPQNVTADGTNVSWDEVENATSYEVIEGGNNVLGTVEGATTDELAGTWVFNDTIDIGSSDQTFVINFTSNSVQYTAVGLAGTENPKYLVYTNHISTAYASAYSDGDGWTNEAYKIITIASKLSEVTNGDALLAWLKANATKQ